MTWELKWQINVLSIKKQPISNHFERLETVVPWEHHPPTTGAETEIFLEFWPTHHPLTLLSTRFEMDATGAVKVLVNDHPMASKEVIAAARQTARAFAAQLQEEGRLKSITSVEVTWTPDGKLGGIIVTRNSKDKKTNDTENKENLKSKKIRKPIIQENTFPDEKPSLKIKIKLPSF